MRKTAYLILKTSARMRKTAYFILKTSAQKHQRALRRRQEEESYDNKFLELAKVKRSWFISPEAKCLWSLSLGQRKSSGFLIPGAKRSWFLSPEAKRSWFLSPEAKCVEQCAGPYQKKTTGQGTYFGSTVYNSTADFSSFVCRNPVGRAMPEISGCRTSSVIFPCRLLILQGTPPAAAVYCGSVPKFKPRYTAVQGISIDLNSICGSSWTTEEEALSQDPQDRKARSIALETFWIKKNLQTERMSEGLLGSQRGLIDCSDPEEGTLQSVVSRPPSQRLLLASKPMPPIQKRLPSSEPRRMRNREQKQLRPGADSDDSDGKKKEPISMPKAYKVRAPSQIMCHRPSVYFLELVILAMGNGVQTPSPQLPLQEVQKLQLFWFCCGGQENADKGGNEKMSLEMPLIPHTPKSARPLDEAPHGTAVSLPSSQHLVFQKALEIREKNSLCKKVIPLSLLGYHMILSSVKPFAHQKPRAEAFITVVLSLVGNRHHAGGGMRSDRDFLEPVAPLHLPTIQAKEMDPEQQGLRTCEAISPALQHHGGGKISERDFHETVAPLCLPPIQAKEMDHAQQRLHTHEPILPALQHHVGGGMKPDRELREPVALLRLPHIQAKEMDHLMSPHLQSDANSKDSNGRIDVTLSMSVQKISLQQMRVKELLCRQKKKEREKSSQFLAQDIDPGDAAEETMPLPATAADSVEYGEKSEHGDDQEARPFPDAQQGLLNTLTWLSSDDWEEKTKGLFSVRHLAIYHSEVLLSGLHDVSLAVTKEVNNLRWKVSLLAINTLGELFRTMKKHMDPEVDEVTRVLLQRMGNCSTSIQKAANQCLGIMVGSVTPARTMTALMACGIHYRNDLVRKCAAEHLLTTMEKIGTQKLLSGTCDHTEVLVRAVMMLAQDCRQNIRTSGMQLKISSDFLHTFPLFINKRAKTVIVCIPFSPSCVRCYGRKMLSILMSHQKFEKYLKRSVPSLDLEDVMATIRQKVSAWQKGEMSSLCRYLKELVLLEIERVYFGCETQTGEGKGMCPCAGAGRGIKLKCEAASAKESMESMNSGQKMPQNNLPSDAGLRSGSSVPNLPCQSVHHTSVQAVEESEEFVEESEEFMELYRLLTAEDFQSRLEGVQLLRDHCKSSPWFITTVSVQIFGVFVLRIQDCNKKVKQQALEALAWMTSMLRNALHPVLVSLVEAVTNLNSKHPGIYAAAVKALEAFIAQLGKVDLWHGLSSAAASASQSQVTIESVDCCCGLWKYPSAARDLGSTTCILFVPVCCIMWRCVPEWVLLYHLDHMSDF
ncbi:LOW QUALITY PROTEIN: TOG array regulator of axonemal microtubules protein 2 [Guaruba guarouba]